MLTTAGASAERYRLFGVGFHQPSLNHDLSKSFCKRE
jgi:hypothetical protein